MENNLPDFPGIDNQTGLTMTGGKPAFFLKMLAKFANSYSSAAAEITQMLADGDFESAVIKAHSIKGVAGTLGANTLHGIAGELEAALKNDPLNVDTAIFASFSQELTVVTNGIKANM